LAEGLVEGLEDEDDDEEDDEYEKIECRWRDASGAEGN